MAYKKLNSRFVLQTFSSPFYVRVLDLEEKLAIMIYMGFTCSSTVEEDFGGYVTRVLEDILERAKFTRKIRVVYQGYEYWLMKGCLTVSEPSLESRGKC